MTPDGKSVAPAEFEIGDSEIMLSDEFSDMKMLLPSIVKGFFIKPISLYLFVDNVYNTLNLQLQRALLF
jgi:PhnB protein